MRQKTTFLRRAYRPFSSIHVVWGAVEIVLENDYGSEMGGNGRFVYYWLYCVMLNVAYAVSAAARAAGGASPS